MPDARPSVLHVLPHPGGGGEAYVESLAAVAGDRSETAYLSPGTRPNSGIPRRLAALVRDVRRFDLVHVHGDATAMLCLPLLAGRPSVVTLHGLHLSRRSKGLRREALGLCLRATVRTAATTICVSHAEHAQLGRIAGAGAARRAVVVQNGVRLPLQGRPEDRLAVRRDLGLDPGEPVAIWVGALDGRKDPLTAVGAAARAGIALLVVGDGPLEADVRRSASPPVRVLGPRADVPRLLAASDVYVLTSRREGLAFSLLEAMSHGLAPVVTELPENVEAVGPGAPTIAPGDVDGLARALSLLAGDESRRAKSGAQARQRVVERFGAERMLAETRAVYERALALRAD